jgi:hypothetical protein
VKDAIFRDVTPCSQLEFHRRFGETHCTLFADYSLGLRFDPVDERSEFVGNVGELSEHTLSRSGRCYSLSSGKPVLVLNLASAYEVEI